MKTYAFENSPDQEAICTWLIQKLSGYLYIDATEIDIHEPFASYGLSSINAVSLSGELEEWLGATLSPTLLYNYPTIHLLASFLADVAPGDAFNAEVNTQTTPMEPIAIIGIGCRFPASIQNAEEFWHFLRIGGCSISPIPEERWNSEDFYDPDPTAEGKMYTRSGSFLQKLDHFDSAFFNISPREALRMDPQQRLLLEVTWEALEHAGIAADSLRGSQTGVFIGFMNMYDYAQLQTSQDETSTIDDPYYGTGSASSIAAGRLSYLFDLQGPNISVDTACSSSLVALHQACQSLRDNECNLALVGGVNAIIRPESMVNACKMGMLSIDGYCKTFDSAADGFALGEGCGIVVLKRLSDAQVAHDTILAIVRGSAINQDGGSNGITAPNGLAQQSVIRQALTRAKVEPHQVDYVEAHGSGTALGDPIEIEALNAVYGRDRSATQPLVVGAVKTNIGHLAGAAGIAGLIKTVLSLHYKEIPPHLHLNTPNPHIDWSQMLIHIPTSIQAWHTVNRQRFAGVSSFGWSGTNVHVILEEAPETSSSDIASRPWQLLPLSAYTDTALETTTNNIQKHLQQHSADSLADVAYTLQTGRKKFKHRRVLLCRNQQEALALLETRNTGSILEQVEQATKREVIFLLPGVGEQYPGMAHELYQQEPIFREAVERCCTLFKQVSGKDLQEALYPASLLSTTHKQHQNGQASSLNLQAILGRNRQGERSTTQESGKNLLVHTEFAQPAVFTIEYALSQLLMHWGILPQAMLGYSLGEYVAATLAGVLSLEDALTLVTQRAQLIASQPAGVMVAVALSEENIQPYLNEQVNLAVINAPSTCVLAGPQEAVSRVELQLERDEVAYRRIETTHAFHSSMLTPLKEHLIRIASSITLHPPYIPYISNVTGTWITNAQATDPAYWAEHMCGTVRFADGVQHLLQETDHLLVEVGIGQALSSFVRQHPACTRTRMAQVITTQPAYYEQQSSYACLLTALGKLWLAGLPVDWNNFYSQKRRQRIALPTYPFEHQRYWVKMKDRHYTADSSQKRTGQAHAQERKKDIANWFCIPTWKQAPPLHAVRKDQAQASWLIFLDEYGIGRTIAQHLKEAQQQVITVTPGSIFQCDQDGCYNLDPTLFEHYQMLLQDLNRQGKFPQHIVHLWSVTRTETENTPAQSQHLLNVSFYSMLALIRALGEVDHEHCTINIVSNGIYDMLGHEHLWPEKATLIGPCRVIPQEYPTLDCRLIEFELAREPYEQRIEQILALLTEELFSEVSERVVALRGHRRWVPTFEELSIKQPAAQEFPLREGGVYLITGGLGGIGLALADYLARMVHARLILTARTAFPPPVEWPALMQQHDADTQLGRQLRAVMALEEQGAQIMVLRADVSDEVQMQHAIEQTLETFGALHGVLHTAGVPGIGLMQLKTPEMAAKVLAPKVQGTLVLERVLRQQKLDFLVLFSSVTALIGGPGQVDYSAANAFLDAYARCNYHKHGMTISVDWGEWQWNVWQEGLTHYGEATRTFFQENRRKFGISFAEGCSVLERVLAFPHAQIIVSTQHFQELVTIGKTFTAATLLKQEQSSVQQSTTLAQRTVSASYVAPRNEIEQKVSNIWAQALGISMISINDNFFDLGGNSLIGVQLIAHLRKEFKHDSLPSYMLYEAPSIAIMALYLAKQNQESAHIEDLNERNDKRRAALKKRARERVG